MGELVKSEKQKNLYDCIELAKHSLFIVKNSLDGQLEPSRLW